MTLITGSWDPGGQSKQTNSYFEARHRFFRGPLMGGTMVWINPKARKAKARG